MCHVPIKSAIFNYIKYIARGWQIELGQVVSWFTPNRMGDWVWKQVHSIWRLYSKQFGNPDCFPVDPSYYKLLSMKLTPWASALLLSTDKMNHSLRKIHLNFPETCCAHSRDWFVAWGGKWAVIMYADGYSGVGDPEYIYSTKCSLQSVGSWTPSHSIREVLNYIAPTSETLWCDSDINLDVV